MRRPFSEICGFHAKQLAASRTSDAHQFTLYGGSRGPGKSYWLRWDLLRELLKLAGQGVLGAAVGLFCEDYRVLADRQISRIELEFPRWMGELKDTKAHGLGFHLRPEYGGGILALRNLDDPSKYQSAEFAAIGVDEITKHEVRTFNILRGSLRWPGVAKPRFKAGTNPGGVGHQWVRDYFIDGNLPKELEPLRSEFAFVKALPQDNDSLPPDYWEMLNTLPPALAKAWVEGDWDVIEGAFFEEWRPTQDGQPWHVIPTGAVNLADKLYWTEDYGYGAPWAGYLIGFDYDGRCTVYREIYETQVKASDQAVRTIELLMANGVDPGIVKRSGHDIFQRQRGAEGPSEPIVDIKRKAIVAKWGEQARAWGNYVSGGGQPNSRLNRAMQWREYLADWGPCEGWPAGRPGIQIMDCCKSLVRAIPLLTPDKNNPEIVDTELDDHGYDAIGNELEKHPGRPKRPASSIEIFPRRMDEEDRLRLEAERLERLREEW